MHILGLHDFEELLSEDQRHMSKIFWQLAIRGWNPNECKFINIQYLGIVDWPVSNVEYNKLCAWRHNMPRPSPPRRAPPGRRNVAVLSHAEYVPTLTAAAALYALRPRWVKRLGDLDLWPFDLGSGVGVTCDVGYFCANFGLPRPLCSRVIPDVRDKRQTSDTSIA